jgi:hypothetical protein
MATADVDAVIAALRTVLEEAEARHSEYWWKTHIVNRWIRQLPGAWWGRWRSLRLRGDNYSGMDATRENLITHVRATLAYLESNRDAIAAKPRRWAWRKTQVAPQKNKGAVPEPASVEVRQRPKLLH